MRPARFPLRYMTGFDDYASTAIDPPDPPDLTAASSSPLAPPNITTQNFSCPSREAFHIGFLLSLIAAAATTASCNSAATTLTPQCLHYLPALRRPPDIIAF